MDREDWGELGFIVMVVVVVFVVVGGIAAGGAYIIDRPACYAQTANIELPSHWSFWGGCQVEISEGRWVPLDNWYYIEKK